MDPTKDLFCQLCGANDEAARADVYLYMRINPKVQLCCNCAGAIADTFEKRHGGWTDQPSKKVKVYYVSNGKRKKVHERDFYRCLKCGTHKDLTIDHIIPTSKGGENTIENMQTLCHSCNSSKGAR